MSVFTEIFQKFTADFIAAYGRHFCCHGFHCLILINEQIQNIIPASRSNAHSHSRVLSVIPECSVSFSRKRESIIRFSTVVPWMDSRLRGNDTQNATIAPWMDSRLRGNDTQNATIAPWMDSRLRGNDTQNSTIVPWMDSRLRGNDTQNSTIVPWMDSRLSRNDTQNATIVPWIDSRLRGNDTQNSFYLAIRFNCPHFQTHSLCVPGCSHGIAESAFVWHGL